VDPATDRVSPLQQSCTRPRLTEVEREATRPAACAGHTPRLTETSGDSDLYRRAWLSYMQIHEKPRTLAYVFRYTGNCCRVLLRDAFSCLGWEKTVPSIDATRPIVGFLPTLDLMSRYSGLGRMHLCSKGRVKADATSRNLCHCSTLVSSNACEHGHLPRADSESLSPEPEGSWPGGSVPRTGP
jgi:hypothetical protein